MSHLRDPQIEIVETHVSNNFQLSIQLLVVDGYMVKHLTTYFNKEINKLVYVAILESLT